MTSFKRQEYIDVKSPAEAQALGYNLFQLKYDGIWSRTEITNFVATTYSQTENIKAQQYLQDFPNCTLISEYMYGSQWAQQADRKGKFFVFDAESLYGESLLNLPYYERYLKLTRALTTFPQPCDFRVVACGRMEHAEEVWQRIVSGQVQFEGLVFRKSDDLPGAKLARCKKEITDDVIVLGVYEGTGRLAGSLGGLVVGKTRPNGQEIDLYKVGGGFSDSLRTEIWHSWPAWKGRVIECIGKERFTSGALRHPNFKRVRDDKLPTDCVIYET